MDWTSLKKKVNSITVDLSHKTQKTASQLGGVGKQMVGVTGDWAHNKYAAATQPTSEHNWYLRAAKVCESVSDAISRNKKGVSTKVSKGLAAKLGAASATAGIFSIASLIGTASTGTAIGSLSGAAFTSAALAWVGGSVAIGSLIVGVAAITGGIGAAIGAAFISKKFIYGKKRQRSELEEQELRVVDACLALAVAFREKKKLGNSIDPVSAKILYKEALQPLCEELFDIHNNINSWPKMAGHRLKTAVGNLVKVSGYLRDWSASCPNIATGVVSVVFLQLLADDLVSFNSNEELVLDALRRSSTSLADASNEELSSYIKGMEPSQYQGLQNNIKGIYHELRYAAEENRDGDEYIVELFEATNHPGADVKITNLLDGEVREVQLKATSYSSLICEHNKKYESIDVFATSEVAEKMPDVESTGLSNEELTQDVDGVMSDLDNLYASGVASSMGVAGIVAIARNVNVLLKGTQMSKEEKQKLVKDGAISAGVAGLISLILG